MTGEKTSKECYEKWNFSFLYFISKWIKQTKICSCLNRSTNTNELNNCRFQRPKTTVYVFDPEKTQQQQKHRGLVSSFGKCLYVCFIDFP